MSHAQPSRPRRGSRAFRALHTHHTPRLPGRRPAILAATALALAVPPVAAFAYVDQAAHPSVVTATLPAPANAPEVNPGGTGSNGAGPGGLGGQGGTDSQGGSSGQGGQSNPYGGRRRGQPYGRGGGTTSGTIVSSAPGVLLIDGSVPASAVGGNGGTAAGTGMVLSPDGYALTNYHVVQDTAKVQATVADTGTTYTAKVVGADATHDVALLKLQDAADLTPVTIDHDQVSVGQAVAAVGNGGGQDKLYKVTGTVQQLDDDIVVAADATSSGNHLSGLIRTNAAVVPGYSGGPLFDAQGEVMGINTAASAGGSPEGFAIPIQRAVAIADQIKTGKTNGTVRVGARAVLGVSISPSTRAGTFHLPGRDQQDQSPQRDQQDRSGQQGQQGLTGSGAQVLSVADGSPAATAGITQGSTITAVDGTPVADGSALQAAISAHAVGDQVRITWTDANGTSHTRSATLGASPLN